MESTHTTSHSTVLIAGGGPAGSAAAFTLAKRGISVCLIDKAVFPREKLCGGLLTLRSRKVFAEVFGADWEKTYNYASTGIRFMTRDGYLNGTDNYSQLYFTHRLSFDDYLLRLAREAGAEIHEGDSLLELSPENNHCTLRSGTRLTYDYLIGADGVNSTVAKTLFGASFNKKSIGFALEIEVPRAAAKRDVQLPEVYFDSVRWGYGWVFPKAETLTVGVGGIHRLNPDMKDAMVRFHEETTGISTPGKIKGHYIPFGDFRNTPGRNNVLLAGDAAGFVEPISGEGIAYAMQSGYLAALSISESIATGKSAISVYRKKSRGIARDIRASRRMRYLVFPPFSHRLMVRILPSTGSLVRKHLDLMADELSYRSYIRFLLKKAAGKIARKLIGKKH